jgi:hypothetical protein
MALIKTTVTPNKDRAVRRVKAAVEMLDAAADNLPIDSQVRRKIVTRRQDLEDLVEEMTR